jgi:hypothetical protein
MSYEQAKHSTNTITLEVETFTLNDIPTCYSWSGLDGKPKEICKFLLAENFGTVHRCACTGKVIEEQTTSPTLRPTEDCLLWPNKGVN